MTQRYGTAHKEAGCSAQDLPVNIEPAAIFSHETGTLVKDSDGATVEVRGAEFDDAGVVMTAPANDIDNLKPSPQRIVGQVELVRPRRLMPRTQ